MPIFQVKKDCRYLDMFPKTNILRRCYKPGETVELSSIDEGNQSERLIELNADQVKELETLAPVIAAKAVEKDELGDLFNAPENIEARRAAIKDKLSALAGKSK